MHRSFRSGAVGGFVVLFLLLLWTSTQTPVADFFETCKSGTPEQVADAIKAGADVHAKDEDGLTPLMFAALENKNPEVIAALLRAGADVNAKDNEGRTALDMARQSNNTRAVTELIKAGAQGKGSMIYGLVFLVILVILVCGGWMWRRGRARRGI